MIREIETKDAEQIINLSLEFAKKSQAAHTFSVSQDRIRAATALYIGNPGVVSFCIDEAGDIKGFIFGLVVQVFFSEELIVQELAFFAHPGLGGLGLIAAFEKRVSEMGIKKIVMGSKPAFYDLSAFYLRRGYTLLENQYIKVEG